MIFPQKFVGVPRTLEEYFGYGKDNRCCGAEIVRGFLRPLQMSKL
jgi:hypothetical protein